MSHPRHPTEEKAFSAEEAGGGVGATAEALGTDWTAPREVQHEPQEILQT